MRSSTEHGRFGSQRGQTTLLFILITFLFLAGFIALAVDFSNLWFKRQAAQGAADAACQAAAVNLLLNAQGTPTATQGFTIGTDFNCSATPNASPCKYAKINGYPAPGLTTNMESNEVQVSFPGAGSVPGVSDLPGRLNVANQYVRVDVIDRTRVYFSSLITGRSTQDVRAAAVCGLVLSTQPIPIIVLNPTCPHTFEVSGSATLKIVGGPSKSVEVNSLNSTCAAATTSTANQCNGNGTIDLSQGGPNFSGSNFGVFGAPTSSPSRFIPGGGSWVSPSTPILDPFSGTSPPPVPPATDTPAGISVGYGVNGCPDHAGCTLYHPGLYTQPIVVENATAIFDPGIYYIQPTSFPGNARGGNLCGTPPAGCVTKATGNACIGDFVVGTNGVVRPSAAAIGASGGTFFYLSGSASAGYGGAVFYQSAGSPGGRTVDNFDSTQLICPGGTQPDPRVGIPSSLPGNVLLGQCTKGGTYTSDTVNPGIGIARGIIFFQDHANQNAGGQMNFQGSGGLLISGTLYSHANDHSAFIQLQGTPGSGTFVFGQIITDQLNIAGNGAINMQLSPDKVIDTLKVQLLR